MNLYSIKSKTEKIDGGFHKLSAHFHHFICIRNGVTWTPYATELEITVGRNICVTSVHRLDSSFSCSLKVGSGTRYYSI